MSESIKLPLLPLRDVVVYPHMVIPLYVGREESIHALEVAMESEKQIFLIAQKDADIKAPKASSLYKIGTVATILQMLRLPDGTIKVLIEGTQRAKMQKFSRRNGFCSAEINLIEPQIVEEDSPQERELDALVRQLHKQFEKYIKMNKKIPLEVLSTLSSIKDPGRFTDNVAAHMTFDINKRQIVLEALPIAKRLEKLIRYLIEEIELAEVDKRIQGRVKSQVETSQKSYYLNEKIRAIQTELGELGEGSSGDDLKELEDRIKKTKMSAEARDKAMAEFNKLKLMPPMSAEATVVRNYIDTLLDVPWSQKSKVRKDIQKAEKVLDSDHYGLEKVKERILEYLAVQQRVEKLKGPILCLVGPPGVGKTSLGQSIANATGRTFVRMSLGGVRDEAEIRGHRRTYIGAMPGKIIQKLIKSKVKNPLFMLDEVDKMAMDFRGDPASALLEVLDPEQNDSFNDHYLEVDYDLSDVMFIATSNSMNIPAPLLDRMEVIRLAGYTEDEKVNIASRYLAPRQIKQNGLKETELTIGQPALRELIRYYTREAGVRNLEREIAKICRKVVKEILSTKAKITKKKNITPAKLEDYLGVKKFRFGLAEELDQIGQVTGLAWTEVGGELLTIEAQTMPGKGKFNFTGSLGDVMQESIQAAITVVRSRAAALGISDDIFQTKDLHIHVPEGATPKDGPSAGIGMVTALVSTLTNIEVKADVAMTGEITLRGEVLPIGGLKEKLLAALRGGIKTVIIPHENERDLKEMPKNITTNLQIKPVRWVDEVLDIALSQPVMPRTTNDGVKTKRKTKTTKRSSAH